ncbi:hypothetical protein BWU74_17200 [Paraburkholderia caledonica]|nr:hypothetical protein BWU74_17200 [Burkholderia sp. Bk]
MPTGRRRFYDGSGSGAAAHAAPAAPQRAAKWHAYCAANLAGYVAWRTERGRPTVDRSQLGARRLAHDKRRPREANRC